MSTGSDLTADNKLPYPSLNGSKPGTTRTAGTPHWVTWPLMNITNWCKQKLQLNLLSGFLLQVQPGFVSEGVKLAFKAERHKACLKVVVSTQILQPLLMNRSYHFVNGPALLVEGWVSKSRLRETGKLWRIEEITRPILVLITKRGLEAIKPWSFGSFWIKPKWT